MNTDYADSIIAGDRFYSPYDSVYVTAILPAYRSSNGFCWEVVAEVPDVGIKTLRFGFAETVRFNA